MERAAEQRVHLTGGSLHIFEQLRGLKLVSPKWRDLVPTASGYPMKSTCGRPPAVRRQLQQIASIRNEVKP